MAIERLNVAQQYWKESGVSHVQRYLFALERVSGRILDVACGTGYGSYILGTPHRHEVTGVDVSAEAIAAARAEHAKPNVTFHLGTLESLAADTAPYDAAVSLETIEHVPDPVGFLQEVHRRLKPGARLIISAPNVYQHTRAPIPVPNPFHLHEPTYAELHAWLAGRFRILEEWEQSRLVPGQYERLSELVRASAALTQYKSIRLLTRLESAVRRLCGKPLPPIFPPVSHSDLLVYETVLMPLLPARRDVAHTYLFVAEKIG